jgi:hypothetical protein
MKTDIPGNVVVVIRGEKHTYNIADLLEIDENNLSKEFASQAALFGFFATAQAEAEMEMEMASSAKDREYATADEYYRSELERKEKKYTEAVIRSSIIRDVDYVTAEQGFHIAEHNANMLKMIVKALGQRAEMLISLGAHLRAEADMTGMSIKTQANVAQEAREAIISKRKSGQV